MTTKAKADWDVGSFLVIDHVQDHEINLVRQSWIRSYRKLGLAKYLDKDLYFDCMTAHVNAVLADHRCRVITARAKVEQKIVLGYMVVADHNKETRLDYLFVKQGYRKKGIGSHLLSSVFKDETVPLVCGHFPGNPSKIKSRASLSFMGRPVTYKPRGII